MAPTNFEIDLGKVSISEYRKVANSSVLDGEGDEILARSAGLTKEEVQALAQPDYRLLLRAFFKKANEPLADPI